MSTDVVERSRAHWMGVQGMMRETEAGIVGVQQRLGVDDHLGPILKNVIFDRVDFALVKSAVRAL